MCEHYSKVLLMVLTFFMVNLCSPFFCSNTGCWLVVIWIASSLVCNTSYLKRITLRGVFGIQEASVLHSCDTDGGWMTVCLLVFCIRRASCFRRVSSLVIRMRKKNADFSERGGNSTCEFCLVICFKENMLRFLLHWTFAKFIVNIF